MQHPLKLVMKDPTKMGEIRACSQARLLPFSKCLRCVSVILSQSKIVALHPVGTLREMKTVIDLVCQPKKNEDILGLVCKYIAKCFSH